jgi:hypothetical protein
MAAVYLHDSPPTKAKTNHAAMLRHKRVSPWSSLKTALLIPLAVFVLLASSVILPPQSAGASGTGHIFVSSKKAIW